ncbi:hypothetical protein [Demequina iriomotensis]|uniref:hypothetical protein n=1 Tax=Demequina iriomotensis TaxID=1536641 RepID=UPI0007865A0D|nr:hypothetical protein [Demequina iriomotensis]
MGRSARWAIVLGGIVVWAAMLAVLSAVLPIWVIAVALVLPPVLLEGAIRRFLGLARTHGPVAREAGPFTVTVAAWGDTPDLVLAAARAEGADPAQMRTVREAMRRGAPLIVRRRLSEAAAREVAADLERAGAVVAVEESRD